MTRYLEDAVWRVLKLPIFPRHWDNYFYNYFALRESGYSKMEAKEMAIKKTYQIYKK